MPLVLTTGSTLICNHKGSIDLPKVTRSLTVGGKPVLIKGDLNKATITTGCITVDDTSKGTQKCRNVKSALGGTAGTLAIGGKPVLLDTISGTTDGLPVLTAKWSVQDAGHAALKAG
jgi:hypothetical protein